MATEAAQADPPEIVEAVEEYRQALREFHRGRLFGSVTHISNIQAGLPKGMHKIVDIHTLFAKNAAKG